LTDHFSFVAFLWEDDNLPITYEFGYISNSGLFQSTQTPSEAAVRSLLLPAGADYLNFMLTCVLIVRSNVNMNSTVAARVRVSPSLQYENPAAMERFVNDSLAHAYGNQDLIQQTLSYATSLVNEIDCPDGSSCLALYNRFPCEDIANTCGECRPGYAGESGSANNRCYNLSASSQFLAVASKAQVNSIAIAAM
jgi:hypothetical protein